MKEIPDAAWKFQILLLNSRRCSEISEAAWEFQMLLGNFRSCFEISDAAWKFQTPLGNSRPCLKFPDAAWKFQTLLFTGTAHRLCHNSLLFADCFPSVFGLNPISDSTSSRQTLMAELYECGNATSVFIKSELFVYKISGL
jgi:hypothetical protein